MEESFILDVNNSVGVFNVDLIHCTHIESRLAAVGVYYKPFWLNPYCETEYVKWILKKVYA